MTAVGVDHTARGAGRGPVASEPALRILDFHPNLVYGNYRSIEEYAATKHAYHDPDRLLGIRRRPGRGVRDVFSEVPGRLAAAVQGQPVLRESGAACRARTADS